jgi:hypothetical protein
MRIRWLTGCSDGVTSYKPRDVVEWDDAEAKRYVEAGAAVETDEPVTVAGPTTPAPVAPKKKGK